MSVFGVNEAWCNERFTLILDAITKNKSESDTRILKIENSIGDLLAEVEKLKIPHVDEELNEKIGDIVSTVTHQGDDLKTLREVMQRLTDIVAKIAMERQVIEPPKEQTPEEKVEDIREELDEIEPVDTLESPEDEKINKKLDKEGTTCLKCKKKRHLINVENYKNPSGKWFKVGRCRVCNAKVYRAFRVGETA